MSSTAAWLSYWLGYARGRMHSLPTHEQRFEWLVVVYLLLELWKKRNAFKVESYDGLFRGVKYAPDTRPSR